MRDVQMSGEKCNNKLAPLPLSIQPAVNVRSCRDKPANENNTVCLTKWSH